MAKIFEVKTCQIKFGKLFKILTSAQAVTGSVKFTLYSSV